MLSSLLGPRGTAIVLDVLAALMAYSFLWALVRVSYERAVGKPMPRTAVTLTLDVLAELANNLPGALHRATGGLFVGSKGAEIERLQRALRVTQAERMDLRAELAAQAVDPPPSGTRPTSLPPPVGLVVLLALGLLGCPRVIREPSPEPPRDGCTQGATCCHAGHPWVCGPDGRWSRADRRCDRLGAVCCTAPSPYDSGLRHACVPAAACVESTDGGVR